MNGRMNWHDPIVNLHIEELLLEGMTETEGAIAGEAFRSELARLIKEGGIPDAWHSGEIGRTAIEIRSEAGAAPEGVGRAVAQGMYGSGGKETGALGSGIGNNPTKQ